jgi:hypothetical protein
MITTFRMHYTHHNVWSILDAGEKEFVTISEWWKSYSTADYTVKIKESINVLRSTALNDCWKQLWPEAVTKLGISRPAGSNDKHHHVHSLKFQDSHISRHMDIQDLLKSHTADLTTGDLQTGDSTQLIKR